MARKHLNIAIFGFGTVAKGFVAALEHSRGLSADIRKIIVKHIDKPRSFPREYFSNDASSVWTDPSIDVIVELTDDAEAALEIVRTALPLGKAVITANKKLIAENFEEILDLQRKHGVPVLYEAAACGSIPVIRNLEEYYDNDLLKGLEGIFNGSSNYVLSKVFQDGLSFPDALDLAFDGGFLEANPSLDLDGTDAAYKLSILIAHAFGKRIAPAAIPCFGISGLGSPELRFAKENNWRLKLVARAAIGEKGLEAWVAPQFVSSAHRLFSVEEEYNAVALEGAFLEGQLLLGKGAGSLPTGSAVLSDLSALSYGYAYEYRKLDGEVESQVAADSSCRVYFRYQDASVLHHIQFEEIEESFRSRDYAYLTGRVKLSELIALKSKLGNQAFFVALLPSGSSSTSSLQGQSEQALLST